jgi:hypothetical protein
MTEVFRAVSRFILDISNHAINPSFHIHSRSSFTSRPFIRRRVFLGRPRLKCDGTRAETRFLLSAKRTSPFKSAGASVQSTAGSRGVRISSSNAGYTMFRGSVKSTGYPLHSPVSPSLPLPCVTVCHHISTELYHNSLHKVAHIRRTARQTSRSVEVCQRVT